MSEQDIFREVDEDLRREEIAKLWDKYGVYALVGAICIVAVVGAYNAYSWWQNKRMAENGSAFYQAATLAKEGKNAEALTALTKLANEAPAGYRLLATLETAALKVKEGKKADAVLLYDQIAASTGDATLKDFARLQAASLRADEADASEMARRLDGLNTDNNPWRYSARELLGLSAFRSGNSAESEKLFTQILSDPFAPAEIRKRAEIMLGLIMKAPGASASAGKDTATQ